MSKHVLERSQILPASLPTVFRFFEDPLNLQRITPLWLGFEVEGATDAEVRLGTEIDYRLRWKGVPLRWRSRISEYEANRLFADEMLVGPYKSWYHRHVFAEGPSGVGMTDVVEYELPLGRLGDAVHAAVVRRQLEEIFDYRRETIAQIFQARAWA